MYNQEHNLESLITGYSTVKKFLAFLLCFLMISMNLEKYFYPANYLESLVWVGVAGSIITYSAATELWALKVLGHPI
jgi:hypothetical protein